jgi:hypothetical protein
MGVITPALRGWVVGCLVHSPGLGFPLAREPINAFASLLLSPFFSSFLLHSRGELDKCFVFFPSVFD